MIKLEKRLDDELYYLRDALPEYSTFPEDMEPEILPDGMPIPINTTKVSCISEPVFPRFFSTDKFNDAQSKWYHAEYELIDALRAGGDETATVVRSLGTDAFPGDQP